MRTSDQRSRMRSASCASVLLLGLCAAAAAGAADGGKAEGASPSCHEETRRVAVWQQGGNPKFNQSPRFENRKVTVCDGKVVARPPKGDASTPEQG